MLSGCGRHQKVGGVCGERRERMKQTLWGAQRTFPEEVERSFSAVLNAHSGYVVT